MTEISGLVVKSKYFKSLNILSKEYKLGEDNRVADIIVHTERLLNIMYTAFSNHIDIKVILGIYCIYYKDNISKKEPCSFFTEEPVLIRIYRNEFKPTLYGFDFSSGEFTTSIRNIIAKYDIDFECKSISIDVTAAVEVNLVEEHDIILDEIIINSSEEDEMEDFEEIPLRSVAISKDYSDADMENYKAPIVEISSVIKQRVIDNEEECQSLKKEIEMLKADVNEKKHQYLSLTDRLYSITNEYSKQMEKLKNIENKYLREQKRIGLLEAENAKKNNEIMQLSKEKEELLLKIEKNKTRIKDKLMELVSRK